MKTKEALERDEEMIRRLDKFSKSKKTPYRRPKDAQTKCSMCSKPLPKSKRNTMGAQMGIQTCSFKCAQRFTIDAGCV